MLAPISSAPAGQIFLSGKRWCEFHFFDSAVSLEQWLATNHGEDAFSYGWFDNDGNAFEVCVRKVKHGDLTLYVSSEATNTIGSWND